LVALDELGAVNVVDFVMLVIGIGNPTAAENHQATAMDGFATFIEVGELVGHKADKSSDSVAGEAAGCSACRDGERDNQSAQEATNAEGD
jgi:hypothetical protein